MSPNSVCANRALDFKLEMEISRQSQVALGIYLVLYSCKASVHATDVRIETGRGFKALKI